MPTSITDRNGNTITVTYSAQNGSYSFTDPLGRTLVSDSGIGSNPETVTIAGLVANSYTLSWTQLPAPTFTTTFTNFGPNNCPAPIQEPRTVLSSIALPDGTSFSFAYDTTYGLLNKMFYPGGGYVRYVWGANPQSESGGFDSPQGGCTAHYDTPAVTDRYVSFDGTNEVLHQNFSYPPTTGTKWDPSNHANWLSKQTVVTNTDSLRGTSYQTMYNYSPVPSPIAPNADPNEWITKQIPVENTIQYYDTSGTLLKTVTKSWLNERIMQTQETTNNTPPTSPQSSLNVLCHNSNEEIIETDEYDFGLATPSAPACLGTLPTGTQAGSLLRRTTTSYASFSPHIVDKPSSIITYDGSGNRAAETDYPSYDANGNLLTKTEQCFAGGSTCAQGNSSTSYTYDSNGQPVTMTDPRNNQTSYSYADSYSSCGGSAPPTSPSDAYLTQVTRPTTNGVNHVTKYCYDYGKGLLLSSTDENNQTTSYTYADTLNRLTQTNYPDGGQTLISYNDSGPNPTVTTQRKLDTSGRYVTSTATMDGLGHTVQSRLCEDGSACTQPIKTDTKFDGLGRVYTQTNPHRSASSSTDGTTTYFYDPLGRTCLIVPPDAPTPAGNSCPTTQPSDTVFTIYSGNCTTVTDEAGKTRQSCSDGLGRLAQVTEDPGSSPHLNYVTTYSYSALDNLTGVLQNGSRQRTFSYDSLSRLISATNPESGAITYAYDANGNLSTKTAPAPNQTGTATVTLSYCYDALNRMTSKAYAAQSCPMSSPVATYAYDSAIDGYTMTNAVGRLVKAATMDGKTATWDSYDPMGRILNQWQCTPFNCGTGNPFAKTFTYDLMGHDASELYAYTYELAKISYGYDSAGRPNQVNSDLVDAQHPATLATVDSSVGYWPTGALRKITFANGLTETAVYNNRLQPCHMNVNSSAAYYIQCMDALPSGNVQDFNYGLNAGTADNGDVASWSATGTQTFNRTYAYDPLNRISSMSSPSDPYGCNGLSWTIDAWGNLTDQTTTAGSCWQHHATVNAATNQLIDPVNNAFQYDAAGNLIADGSHTYAYDAENRITQVDGGSTASYIYDADGRRAWKTVGSTPTDYIYDLSGRVAREFSTGCGYECWSVGYIYLHGGLMALYTNGTTYFVHKDHLSSTRLVTDLTATLEDNLDYLPFGEASPATLRS